ncbi:MAG: hypothetical protein AAGI03_18140, partial [Pseudomonadota bacterium]
MSLAQDIGLSRAKDAARKPVITRGTLLRWGLALLTLGLCVVPFILVFAISFGRKIEGAAWVWDFTFENYQRFFVGAMWPDNVTFLYLQQLGYSFWYAVIASCIAVLTALPFTLLLTRLTRRAQAMWLVFILSSLSL